MPSPSRPLSHVTTDPKEDKEQHWVAKSYLKLWCDPDTPQGASVWVSPKDRSSPPSICSPKKLFVSSDINTLRRDGKRNLLLEKVYHKYETAFGKIKSRVFRGSAITEDDHTDIVTFVSIQMIRTPKFRSMWGELKVTSETQDELDTIEDVNLKSAIEKVMIDLNVNQNPLLSLASFPRVVEILGNMRMMLIRVNAPFGFITSDSPCCVVEYKENPHSIFERLESKTGSAVMPLGPTVAALFHHSPESHEMREVSDDNPLVLATNNIIWKGADAKIVLMKKTPNAAWFSNSVENGLAPYCIL